MKPSIDLKILGTAKDLRTETTVVYGQLAVLDYLALVSGSFDAFEAQRKRTWHPAYQRMKEDISEGALLPTITLTVLPERVPELLRLIQNDEMEMVAAELCVAGRVYILDGLQRSFVLKDLQREGHRFPAAQSIHLEIWLEANIHHFIYRVLVLNSAHKPMSLRHQFKLIFLTLKYRLEYDVPGLVLYQKIPGVRQVRTAGMYTLDQVITCFLCFLMKTPEISRDNVEAQEMAMRELFESQALELGRSFEAFKIYLKTYKDMDREICRVYPGGKGLPGGSAWIGSENVMKSFLTAAARFSGTDSDKRRVAQSLSALQTRLQSAEIGEDPLGLQVLAEITNGIDPRKVNVGYATRAILLNGFESFFDHGGQKNLARCWTMTHLQ